MAKNRSAEAGAAHAQQKGMGPVPASILVLGAIYYGVEHGAWVLVPPQYDEHARIALAIVVGYSVLQLVLAVGRLRLRFRKELDAQRPKESTHSARIATVADLKESGVIPGFWNVSLFFRRAENSVRFYCGVIGRHVLQLVATHVLIIAPTGTGKNRFFVFMYLGLLREPCVVTDVKGENYEVTARYRERRFNHRIIRFGVGGQHSYNPVDLIKEGLAAGGRDVLGDAQRIALALRPEPKDEKNSYWRQGGRDVMALTMIGLCVNDPANANLGTVQMIVSDINLFLAMCEDLEFSPALNGVVAEMARSMLGMVAEKKTALQEYINVAKQAMLPYARAGWLHKLTETSTFRYRDLKYPDAQGRFLTIYNQFDSSRREIFEPFGAMLNSCMLLELQRDPSPQRVVFLNDEATNFVVKDLPALLTILRSDGNVHVVNICQSRARMRATWGAEGEQTILDNSDLKIFFGLNSDEEAKKVSELIGQQNVLSPSYGMGQGPVDGISENRSIAQRPVLTSDMVRREKGALLVYRKERVMRVDLVGVDRCEPMRSEFDVNTRYGNKKFKGPVEVIF